MFRRIIAFSLAAAGVQLAVGPNAWAQQPPLPSSTGTVPPAADAEISAAPAPPSTSAEATDASAPPPSATATQSPSPAAAPGPADTSSSPPAASSSSNGTAPASQTTGSKSADLATAASTQAANASPGDPRPVASPSAAPAVAEAAPFIDLGGYVQAEYQSHADSENQVRQGGALLNQNRFLIRRARVNLKRVWQYSSLEVELDGNTTSGPSIGLYRAEASLFLVPKQDKDAPPYLQLTAGMFRLPFGFETPESSRTRWFMERTQTSRALFPSEIDVGARLSGGYSVFRYAVALTNGEPLGSRGFPLQDPNKSKDITWRLGAVTRPTKSLGIDGGVSLNTGKGFHRGTDATKGIVTWSDTNEDGVVQPAELIGNPSTAEVTSADFKRWAMGADLQLRLDTALGTTTLLGEFILAQNLDRSFFPADPVQTQLDAREFGWHVALLQQITRYGIVGARIEFYDPNADATDRRAGKTMPAKNTVWAVSPMLGLNLPDRARLAFQYDFIRDYLARDKLGVPADLSNNQWTLRLQVNL